MSSSISPNDRAKIGNNFESSKLFNENLLFEPNARENSQKGIGNVAQYFRSNQKYSESSQNYFRSNNSSRHCELVQLFFRESILNIGNNP